MAITTLENGEIFGRHAGTNCEWPVAAMELTTRTMSIPLTSAVVWDSGQPLPSTAANDDLGFAFGAGISASVTPVIETGDIKASSSTRKCAVPIILPANYETGKALTLKLYAAAKTTVADTSMTLDAEVFKSDQDGTSNADIIATAAQSINSLTHAELSFTITPTGLAAGDNLWALLSIAYVDSATATAVIGQIGGIDLAYQSRG